MPMDFESFFGFMFRVIKNTFCKILGQQFQAFYCIGIYDIESPYEHILNFKNHIDFF
jgi:hypothetical protein